MEEIFAFEDEQSVRNLDDLRRLVQSIADENRNLRRRIEELPRGSGRFPDKWFELTETLTAGESAEAKLLKINTNGQGDRVYEATTTTQTIYDPSGKNSGSTGDRFRCTKSVDSAQWEIIGGGGGGFPVTLTQGDDDDDFAGDKDNVATLTYTVTRDGDEIETNWSPVGLIYQRDSPGELEPAGGAWVTYNAGVLIAVSIYEPALGELCETEST